MSPQARQVGDPNIPRPPWVRPAWMTWLWMAFLVAAIVFTILGFFTYTVE
jgi:hypothetical protein